MKAYLYALLALQLPIAASAKAPEDTRPAKTTLVMGLDIANGIVAPGAPSRVRVPPLERVELTVPTEFSLAVQWTKDGEPIPGATERVYTIDIASAADSGVYGLANLPFPTVATGIRLDVVPTGNIANVSTLVKLEERNPQIVGFTVSGGRSKNLLFRAVGPSLTAFSIRNPAGEPRIEVYNARGEPVQFVYPAMIYDFAEFFGRVGAFPLTGGEALSLSFGFGQFEPGAYSIHVHDASGAGGTALVEVYEFEEGPRPLQMSTAR